MNEVKSPYMQPCPDGEDLISRQAAVDALKEHCGEPWTEWDAAHNAGVEDSISVIEALPSAEPKKGKWEIKPDPFGFFHDIPVCSECGCTPKMREKTKYCPNCGAKMLTKESTENLNLKADGEGVSKGGVSNGDTD